MNTCTNCASKVLHNQQSDRGDLLLLGHDSSILIGCA